MNTSVKRRTYRLVLGPLFLAAVVGVYRSWSLAREISPDTGTLFAGLLVSDGVTLGLIVLLAVAAAGLANLSLRVLALFGMGVLSFAMMLDAFIVLSLDERLNLLDLRQYLPETDVIASFLSPLRLALFLLFLASFALTRKVGRRTLAVLSVVAVFAIAAGLVGQNRYPDSIQRYTAPVVAVMSAGFADRSRFRYEEDDLAHYLTAYRQQQQARPLPGHPNMILLIVESLSSINSRRVSGAHDWLPGFDELSGEGTLFVNFFANHAASEGGIISLLSGFPPMHYPGARPLMFEEFRMQVPVLRSLQEMGYYTEFLTTTRLDFITMDQYIAGIGFNTARGRDEVPDWADAPRFAQDAPSDELLYSEALETLDELEAASPWLFVLATSSSHLPYRHPAGEPDTPEAVWEWVSNQLLSFHAALQEWGFYEDGILLITGDHRQMRPIADLERDRYGDSAKARIPLLIIGDGIPGNSIDRRFYQQSDLFRVLSHVLDPDAPLSPNPIWVKRYNRKYGKIGRTGHLTIFSESDGSEGKRGYELYVSGNRGEWLEERPPEARRIEMMVHAQRAAHQHHRNRQHAECVPADGELTTGQIVVEEAGAYWFRLHGAAPGACLRLDGETLIPPDAIAGQMVQADLLARTYQVDIVGAGALFWLQPGRRRSEWDAVPLDVDTRQEQP